ncbi:unnamed protein product [Zymoseptoria tritici ST99CH_3D7]|uniref:Uncharacterized protein n=2 Tax=Zymoseptoria tritici TaxID=1047171 RepID=A0A1X7RT24_ZYMT9|nr:unnamed protein product [Zymoseptoria tritici ST99CH_3D7]SMR52375.1 unnamed protein product [Zymoseptoria tritici ST99CH_1E4]
MEPRGFLMSSPRSVLQPLPHNYQAFYLAQHQLNSKGYSETPELSHRSTSTTKHQYRTFERSSQKCSCSASSPSSSAPRPLHSLAPMPAIMLPSAFVHVNRLTLDSPVEPARLAIGPQHTMAWDVVCERTE